MKKQLLKSMLVGAMTLVASGAWAQTVTTYDFEDGNALFTPDSRISASVVEGTQTIYSQDFELDGKAVKFTGASNAQNGYCFAHYDFSSLCDQAAKVKVEFDAVLGNGARSIISVGDASVRGNTGNSTKTTYSNKGAIFRVGTDKNYSYVNGSNVGSSTVVSQKWLKVTIEVDEVAKNYTYSIVNKATEEVLFSNGEEPVAFYSSDATNCTQIDMFGYINSSQMGLIDNLIITVTKDERQQANYTVNFLDTSNNPIKDAVTRSGAVGDPITLLPADKEPLWNAEDTQKYIYQSDDTEGKTIEAAGTTVVNVVYRDAEVYNYTLLSSLGTTLTTGSGFEGESPRVAYPRYQLDGTDLYMAAVDNKEYRTTVNLNEDNVSKTINYTLQEGKVAAFYTEAEDIEGITVATNDNIPVRASNAKAATTTEDVAITTLAPGKYILHVGIFTSKSSFSGFAVNFGVGEEVFAAEFGAVNLNEKASEEYVLNVPTTISYLASSSADTQFDYIWIEKTGDVEVANKTIGLIPGVWNTDGAIFAAYAFTETANAWFPFVEVSGAYATQIPETFTGITIVRLKPVTDPEFSMENNGLNWDNKWNQTGDIDFTAVADQSVISITGWEEADYVISAPVDIDAVKAQLTEAIALATQLNGYANDTELAAAIAAAQEAVAGDDAAALVAAATALQIKAIEVAKTVLAEAVATAETLIAAATNFNIEVTDGLTNAVAAAKALGENAAAEDIIVALQNLMAAALQPAKTALTAAIGLAGELEADEALAAAITTAKAVADNEDADVKTVAAALKGIMDAALAPAKATMTKVIALAEMLGSDDADLAAALAAAKNVAANEEADLFAVAGALKALANAAKPVAQQFVETAAAYMATFNGEAATALAEDFAKLQSDIANNQFAALSADIQTLFAKGAVYIEDAIEKVEGYATAINNETLNADLAALKNAYENKQYAALFAAVKQFETDFCNVAAAYLAQVKAIDTTGKNGVAALNAAIASLETELAAQSPKLMAVALATRNLVLAMQAFEIANTYYTVAGNAEFLGGWAILEANDMTLEGGIYTKTYEAVELTNDFVIEYKIVKNHSWNVSYGFDGKNADYKVWEGDGIYDVTFTFDPATNEVGCSMTKSILTGIGNVMVKTATNGAVYNMNGQRVQKAKKGLYIINGKKVMMK